MFGDVLLAAVDIEAVNGRHIAVVAAHDAADEAAAPAVAHRERMVAVVLHTVQGHIVGVRAVCLDFGHFILRHKGIGDGFDGIHAVRELIAYQFLVTIVGIAVSVTAYVGSVALLLHALGVGVVHLPGVSVADGIEAVADHLEVSSGRLGEGELQAVVGEVAHQCDMQQIADGVHRHHIVVLTLADLGDFGSGKQRVTTSVEEGVRLERHTDTLLQREAHGQQVEAHELRVAVAVIVHLHGEENRAIGSV